MKARVCSVCCAKKHDTILKISRKFLTRSPVNNFARKSLKITAYEQHMNVVSAEMLQGDSVFQRTLDERERVAEDVLLKVFTTAYWILKE